MALSDGRCIRTVAFTPLSRAFSRRFSRKLRIYKILAVELTRDPGPGGHGSETAGTAAVARLARMPSEPFVHTHAFRLVMAEVDVAQIHFTNLFRWMDRGLSEWLGEVGHPFTWLLQEGPGIPVVDVHLEIKGRMMLDDQLLLTTWMAAPRNSSFRSRHRFTRDGQLMAEGEVVHVCVDRETRETVSVPTWLRELAADDDWRPSH